MAEYAILTPTGEVATIVLSHKTPAEIRDLWCDRNEKVVPVADVPPEVLNRYPWSKSQ